MIDMKEAMFYRKKKDKIVQCIACNRRCIINDGKTGFCKVRKNIDGILYSLVYGKPVALHVDPIEKKPIFNFLPGTKTLSFGTYGCNFDCDFCQNYDISNVGKEDKIKAIKEVTPKEIVALAIKNNCPSISYTYTEPTIFIEFAIEIMELAKEKGIRNIWVTNGYMSKDAAKEIVKFLDAANIDLKGNASFYKRLVNDTDVKKVLENIKYFYQKGVHIEVTNLLIEGENTKPKEIEWLCKEVTKISKDIPLHFSKSFPHYKMKRISPTKITSLKLAETIAKKEGIKKVYLGNL